MPISYCCHLISSVELRYSADSPLPSYILKSFKHPRIYDSDNYFANKSSSSSDCADTRVTQRDEITKCNLILESHGYSLIRQNDPEGTVKIKKVGTRGRVGKKRSLELYDKATSQNVMIWRKDDDAIYRIMDMIRKAMIYHVCFYDDTVYENEVLLSRISKVTKESSKVSKNSTYEMLYALHDCLVQLRKKTGDGMEAILITEEYSGLFTKDEILITRSSMAFRSALIDEGIHYNTIYHTTGPNNYTGHMDLNPDDIVCSYLKIPLTSQSQESVRNLDDSLAIVEFQDIDKHAQQDEPSKEAFFRALNLPLSDDYDVNVIFVRGRHHCQKMLRFLAKQAEDVLLNMKKTTLRVAPVKLVLSNFPVLFSKLYELRVTWADLIDQNSSERYAITIKGLVLPTVLSSLFKIARRLQTQGMINEASLLITYNTDLDSELHEDSLQISENNRIYNNFMVNMSSLEKNYPQMYSLLKKMLPYAVFMVRKGRVSVPAHGAMRKQGSICLSHSFGHGDLSSRSVSLYDSNRIQSLYGISNIDYNPDGNGTIVVLRDTLYTNLSKIKSIIQHIEGTSVIKTMPTKVIISEAISRVASVGIADARSYDHNLKCYVDLYPSMEDGNDAIWTYIQPYNLINIVFLVGYLLHAGAYLLFFDPCFTPDGNLDNSLDNRLGYSGTINAEDSVSILDQRLYPDKCTLDMNSLVNDPLAQQSYIIKLIIRVSFNKRFQTVFGLPYKDHLHNTMKLTRNFQDREANSAKRKRSLPSDIHESTPLYLASNWDALIHRSKSLALSISDNYDDDLTEALTNIENLTPESGVVSPRPVDALDITTNSRPTGFTNIVASISSGDIAKISREVSESLTKVSSTTRAHGRLHHCVFHFDTKEPLKGENGISSLEKEIENISNADITPEIKPGNKIHLVFVFLTPKNITPLVSSRIKLLKDVINSSDIVFVHDKSSKENPPMEYNMINAKNFIDTLKVEYVPAKHGNYNEKCGVPYSFVVGIDTLDQHIMSLYNEADVELTTYIYYVCMDIDVSLGQGNCINENKRTLISNTRSKHPGKDIREYFLSYSWICDVYSSGFIDLDADIPEMHLLPLNDGQLKDHYYFSTPMTEHKSAHRGVFPFSIGYQHVKFLWGWNIYVLTLRNEVVSEKDCFLYRKHCGLRVASYNTLDSIANDIKNKLRAELKVHGINEEDVSTYFTHSRIYMNTLIVMGDSMWHPSDFDVACRNANYQYGCLNITFGGKLICFGRYQGIPLLMSTWFTDTMCQSRPAAIHEYTIEHQSSP